jgi:hypothetical protein
MKEADEGVRGFPPNELAVSESGFVSEGKAFICSTNFVSVEMSESSRTWQRSDYISWSEVDSTSHPLNGHFPGSLFFSP